MDGIVNILALVAAIITILGAGGLPVVLPKSYKNRVLITEASKGNMLYVRYSIFAGADIDAKDENGWSALHWAAFRGHINVVKKLIASEANIDSQNHGKCTPLMFALSCEIWTKEKPEIVKYLLECGADVNIRGPMSAIAYAKRDSKELVNLLREYGAVE